MYTNTYTSYFILFNLIWQNKFLLLITYITIQADILTPSAVCKLLLPYKLGYGDAKIHLESKQISLKL